MTLTDIARPVSVTADYATVRTSVGAYAITAPLVRLSGDERIAFLDQVFAKSGEFVDPDTVREVLALNADGSPFAIMLHLELDEVSWLLPRTPVTTEELSAYLGAIEAEDVEVEIAPEGWGASAFEGPQAWAVAAKYVDFDISGLTLHGITQVANDELQDATAHIARVGTSGEYGYLILSDAPDAVHVDVLERVLAEGGAAIGTDGLARVQAEAGMPVYHGGFAGMSVVEADLAWMVDWQRIGEFHGSDELVAPTTESAKIAGLVAAVGSHFAEGTDVVAGDVKVGTIVRQTPSGNTDEELVFAVLESPFWVPGLDLAAADIHGTVTPLRTVTQPRVIARSLHAKIG
jgi:glycine cleavage system aminomethyltransferase T